MDGEPRQTKTALSMTEALYLLDVIDKKNKEERQRLEEQGKGYMCPMDLNDDVSIKTKEYLQKFCHVKEVAACRQIREIGYKNKIDTSTTFQILDLGLREYEEVVSLFPELKDKDRKHVQEILDHIKLHSN